MIAWMIYCVVIGALVSVAALAAEWIARLARRPVRWGWSVAMALVLVLAALAPTRRSPAPAVVVDQLTTAVATDVFSLRPELVTANWKLPSSTTPVVVGLWIAASGLLAFMMFSVHRRMRRDRDAWPVADLHGARVRVSPSTGPVVIGFNEPEIVVPRWVLGRTAADQRLVIAHEAEHVRARDTMLLATASVACALTPWNPAVWFMFSRLRLAVELDCDARVLGRGVAVQSYGELLIDVASNTSPLRFGAAAFANSTSHLHQRILAMKKHAPKFAVLRGGIVGVFGAAALVAACSAELPTAAEIERMDVASAEKRLQPLVMGDSVAIYVVDEVEVPREMALKIKADQMESVEVTRQAGERAKYVIATHSSVKLLKDKLMEVPVKELTVTETTAPIVLIDGVRQDFAALKRIDRSAILSIEVLKGRAALQVYGDDAKNGVIMVTTKK